jgi:hypothetical protein
LCQHHLPDDIPTITGSTIVIVGIIPRCSIVGGERTRRDGARYHPPLKKVDTTCSKFVKRLIDGQHLTKSLELA